MKVSGQRRGSPDLLQELTSLDVRRLVKVNDIREKISDLSGLTHHLATHSGRGWVECCRRIWENLPHFRDLFLLWIFWRRWRGGALLREVDGCLRDGVRGRPRQRKTDAGVLLQERSSSLVKWSAVISVKDLQVRFHYPWWKDDKNYISCQIMHREHRKVQIRWIFNIGSTQFGTF